MARIVGRCDELRKHSRRRSNVANDHPCSVEHRQEHAVETVRIWVGSRSEQRRCVEDFNLNFVRGDGWAVVGLLISFMCFCATSLNETKASTHPLSHHGQIDLTQLVSVTSPVLFPHRPRRWTGRHLACESAHA